MSGLIEFLIESNRIEGIHRPPTQAEIEVAVRFLELPTVTVVTLNAAQAAIAPGKPIRDREGMDVRVGSHVPPRGGPAVPSALADIVQLAARHRRRASPWRTHVDFELLHPYLDGNGRTGRLLWAWQMIQRGEDPYGLPFLHRWYYQSLDAARVGPRDVG